VPLVLIPISGCTLCATGSAWQRHGRSVTIHIHGAMGEPRPYIRYRRSRLTW